IDRDRFEIARQAGVGIGTVEPGIKRVIATRADDDQRVDILIADVRTAGKVCGVKGIENVGITGQSFNQALVDAYRTDSAIEVIMDMERMVIGVGWIIQ